MTPNNEVMFYQITSDQNEYIHWSSQSEKYKTHKKEGSV